MRSPLTLVRLTELDSDFVHGDISPSNIAIVQTASDSRRAILLNFSVIGPESRVRPGAAGFASSFAAPEPCALGTTTPAGDVFARDDAISNARWQPQRWVGFRKIASRRRCLLKRKPCSSCRPECLVCRALSADPEARPSAKEFHAELCPEGAKSR